MSTPYTGSHKLIGPDTVRSLATSIAAGIERGWSALSAAPLHDFPIRDEILWKHLAFAPGDDVLEIGPGSGFTAFRLAPCVRQLTLLDAAPRAINELRRTLGSIPNIEFLYADVAASDLAERMGKRAFDVVFGLDVFEYVTDPAACLRNLASVLRADGELFLTFPNVPPPVGDGATWFTDLTQLDAMIAEAGFSKWEIFAVRPRRFAAAVYTALHEWPLHAYRRVRSGNKGARPQIYEATWAFQHRERLLRFRVVLHLGWILLGWAMRLGGRPMVAEPVEDRPLGRQLVVRAWK